KMAFDVGDPEARPIYEIPYGVLERRADGLERPGQRWAAMVGGKAGLAVINDCKHSFSAEGGELKMMALRSAIYADHYGHRDRHNEYIDIGEHKFGYVIMPTGGHGEAADMAGAEGGAGRGQGGSGGSEGGRGGSGGSEGGRGDGGSKMRAPLSAGMGAALAPVARRAAEFNAEPLYVYETYHKGALPQTYRGITIDGGDVALAALKRAEDGDGYVMRLHEVSGRPAGSVTVDVPLFGVSFKASFAPCEIKTYRLSGGKATELNLIEDDVG
ncbi:MAG: hypothetical protein FWE70_08330, partial [Oscillospiraceae bacterium]|nr:hypothetical protein [Oscillospiraceae bacterium]